MNVLTLLIAENSVLGIVQEVQIGTNRKPE